MPARCGDARHGALALVMEEPREAGGREGQRQRRGAPEDRRRRVDRGDVAQRPRDELDAREGLARAAQAGLRVGGAVGVVEDRARGAPARDRAQVADARRAREAPRGRVELGRARREQRAQLRPAGQATLGHEARSLVSRRRASSENSRTRPSTPLRLARRRRRCHGSSGARSRTGLGGEDAPGPRELGHAAGDVDRGAEPVAAAGGGRPVGDADAHVGEALALPRDRRDEPSGGWR